MPRRRSEAVPGPSADEPAPEWLLRFEFAAWVDRIERPPSWVDSTDPQEVTDWRGFRARRRWSDAGTAWLTERGRERDWYALVHPETAHNLGMRVPPDAKAHRCPPYPASF